MSDSKDHIASVGNLIEQIRRSHKSAKPKRENPAWGHTHRDLGIVLDELEVKDKRIVELEAVRLNDSEIDKIAERMLKQFMDSPLEPPEDK